MQENSKPFTESAAIKLVRSDPNLHYAVPGLNEILYACCQQWTSLDSIHLFTNLKVLYAQSNCLSECPNLQQCPRLNAVFLSDNRIRCMRLSLLPSSIRVLDLARNSTEVIEGFDQMTSLENLDLSGNKLADDSISGLGYAKNLVVLNVSSNRIRGTECFSNLSNLRLLNAKDNPVSGPELRKSLESILLNLRSLNEETIVRE